MAGLRAFARIHILLPLPVRDDESNFWVSAQNLDRPVGARVVVSNDRIGEAG